MTSAGWSVTSAVNKSFTVTVQSFPFKLHPENICLYEVVLQHVRKFLLSGSRHG